MTPFAVPFLQRLVLLAAGASLLAACASPVSSDGGEASCAAVVVYRDVTYWARGGPVKRDPATTGRHVTGVIPPCNDTGRQEPAPARDEEVQAAELAEVPLETALLWNGTVFVREGRELPPETRIWFRSPRCRMPGDFELLADWLGATGPHRPRFDGDLRPPYRLQLHVVEGPARYVGTTIAVHADVSTKPRPGPDDVKASLLEGGQVSAEVRCDAGRFHALALRVPAQP